MNMLRDLLRSTLFLLFCTAAASAQDAGKTNFNTILDPDIRTAQLYVLGAPLVSPIADIKAGNGSLVLQFDHIGSEIKDYIYTLRHCNSDWKPSELEDNEFINGFSEDRILEYGTSFNTLTSYTHYTLALPNQNMRWTKSGNYLLYIWDNDGDERKLVLIRRFVVVEPAWGIEAKFVQPAQVEKLNTHHEIDFSLKPGKFRVPNPQNDVKVFVLQNGRWDNAIGPLKPNFERLDKLVFDYQDKVVFPAGKEWRYFNMSTFAYRGEYVRQIQEYDEFYEVTLYMDENLEAMSYVSHGDIDGRFSIENSDQNRTLLECDYAKVLFSLKQTLPLEDEDVYVFGELSDWRLQPEFKMRHEPSVSAYVCEPWLKQGYYNYKYVTVNRKTGAMDEEEFEGNSYQTSNQYTILAYFRTFGDRYDRLLAQTTLDSRRQ